MITIIDLEMCQICSELWHFIKSNKWELPLCSYPKNTGYILLISMDDIRLQNWAGRKLFIPVQNTIESSTMYEVFDFDIWSSHSDDRLPHLMSMTWLTTTPGWAAFPSPSSYRKSLKSQTTAQTLCQPFFTPVGFGTWKRPSNLNYKKLS